MQQEEFIDARELLRRRFCLVPRGFDQDEVLDLVARLARHIEQLQRSQDPARERLLEKRERELRAAEIALAALIQRVETSLNVLIDDAATDVAAQPR